MSYVYGHKPFPSLKYHISYPFKAFVLASSLIPQAIHRIYSCGFDSLIAHCDYSSGNCN